MKDLEKFLKLALVQAEPILFDKKACIDKTISLIKETKKENPDLIVFPELFIPGYPVGMNFGFSVGKRDENGRKDWLRYYKASIVEGDEDFLKLKKCAIDLKSYLSIGFSERDKISGSLYNSNVIFEPDGSYKIHRKLKPTGSERVVWADADKNYFPITKSPWGNMGSLICWESYMPLARVALYQKGITIYISPNTNDNPEWQDTIKHIAIEGKCYFINSDMIIKKSSYPKNLNENISHLPDLVCKGGSCVIDPFGHYLTKPVWDKEEIIYANLDMDLVKSSKMEHDPIGHYARNDVLDLKITEK